MTAARYAARAVMFRCGDESGIDLFGSDEPYWVFTARAEDGGVHTSRSQVFGDVDSGDSRRFNGESDHDIVWPRRGQKAGAPGPIALSIQLWESEGGNPDKVAEATQTALKLAGLAPGIGQWVRMVPSVVTDKLVDLISDDLMGSKTVLLPAAQLARRLPRPGGSFVVKHHVGGNSGDLPFEVAGGPDYDLYLRITRVA